MNQTDGHRAARAQHHVEIDHAALTGASVLVGVRRSGPVITLSISSAPKSASAPRPDRSRTARPTTRASASASSEHDLVDQMPPGVRSRDRRRRLKDRRPQHSFAVTARDPTAFRGRSNGRQARPAAISATSDTTRFTTALLPIANPTPTPAF